MQNGNQAPSYCLSCCFNCSKLGLLCAVLFATLPLSLRGAAQALDLVAQPVVTAASQIAFGTAYEDQGQDQLAETSYRSALTLDPNSVESVMHLASILEKEKQIAASIHYWRQALVLKPNGFALQSSLGAAYLQNGQNEEAVQTLKPFMDRQPANGAALINLGTALTRLDRYDEAAVVYRKATADPEFSDTATVSLIKVLLTLLHYSDALPLVNTYAKAHPDSAETSCLLGLTYQGLNRNPDAEMELRKAVARKASDCESQYHLGAVLRSEGREREAIPYLQQAITLKPDSRGAHFQLARAYRSIHETTLANQEEATLGTLERASAADTQVSVLENEAHQAEKKHDPTTAVYLYEEILTLLPNDAKVRYDLAVAYEMLHERTQERAMLTEALVRNPSLSVAHSQLGFLDIAEGRKNEGESQLRLALQEDPQNVEAMGNLGVLDAQAGRLEEAQHLLELSVENDSLYEKGYLNLGLVLAAQGDYKKANSALTNAARLDPADASALRALEQIHSRIGDARDTIR